MKSFLNNVMNRLKKAYAVSRDFILKYKKFTIPAGILIVILIIALISSASKRRAALEDFQTAPLAEGSLVATIGATGTVRANQMTVLAWQTTGQVELVNVEVGESVEAGDVLAGLALNSLPQNVILAQAELVSAQRALDNLLNSNTPSAQAQLALVNAQRTRDNAWYNLDNLQNRGNADQQTIDNAWAQYVIARDRASQAQENYDRLAEWPEDDPYRAQMYTVLYNALEAKDTAYDNWAYYTAAPNSRNLAEAQARYDLAQAQLEDAQREWERLADGPDAADITAAQARVAAIEATINMAQLEAPIAGTITEVHPLPGDQVAPGTIGFRIDDLSRLLVDVAVSEVDINSVAVGQPVTVYFDAILDTVYNGEVVQVAQVGSISQGVVSFSVTVELTDADERVKPGMTAAVTIVVSQLDDVLLVPNRAVRMVSGQRVVYVLRGGEIEAVEIVLGASSDEMSVLLEGDLQAGDTIILNPSVELQSSMHPPFIQR